MNDRINGYTARKEKERVFEGIDHVEGFHAGNLNQYISRRGKVG